MQDSKVQIFPEASSLFMMQSGRKSLGGNFY